MPHRLVSLAILLVWAVAAGELLRRDVLPDWLVGPPPDMRSVARAGHDSGPTKWAILIADDPSRPEDRRSVGEAVTKTVPLKDGWLRLTSNAWFDSAGLLKGTALAPARGERLEATSAFDIDPSGNLFHFQAGLRAAGGREELLALEGRVKENSIAVQARGPIPFLTWRRTFPYNARGMVQNAMGPLDKIPGLHVGQRWESRVISPLTGQVEVVRVEVTRLSVIHWGNEPVTVHEVVTRMSALTTRTWVRRDGLVLRQEVPSPLIKLSLERLPEQGAATARPRPRP